jgi:hypothetical protein
MQLEEGKVTTGKVTTYHERCLCDQIMNHADQSPFRVQMPAILDPRAVTTVPAHKALEE